MFLGLPNKGTTFGRMSVLGKEFGVTETCLRQLFEEYLERDFSTERKTRSNKGQTVFNSDKKRKLTFTTLIMYKNNQDKLETIHHV